MTQPLQSERAVTLLFPLIGVCFLAAGIALLRFCWWLSRKDMAFLASVIQLALSRGTSNEPGERAR